jgi:hypothetical protein
MSKTIVEFPVRAGHSICRTVPVPVPKYEERNNVMVEYLGLDIGRELLLLENCGLYLVLSYRENAKERRSRSIYSDP